MLPATSHITHSRDKKVPTKHHGHKEIVIELLLAPAIGPKTWSRSEEAAAKLLDMMENGQGVANQPLIVSLNNKGGISNELASEKISPWGFVMLSH